MCKKYTKSPIFEKSTGGKLLDVRSNRKIEIIQSLPKGEKEDPDIVPSWKFHLGRRCGVWKLENLKDSEEF